MVSPAIGWKSIAERTMHLLEKGSRGMVLPRRSGEAKSSNGLDSIWLLLCLRSKVGAIKETTS